MAVFKCKMCGGTIEFNPGDSVGVCDSCGTKQTLPCLDDDRRANLYDRANHFRRNNEFDKAAGIYEQILNEDTSDAEAYWSLVLCRYGIEYVEDPATHKRVPTVNRTQFTSIFDDEDYKSALQHADGYQREIYESEANAINEIQKGILAISQKEDPFDVFICYKETDASGRRTQDSVLANDLYHQLTNEGFKVFFSRITLEDKLGTAYEPYIFAALNSSKVMVVLGTKPEYFNAVWVKNEWSRYLSLVKQSGGKKVLIPAYRDMDPYDLPEEFSHLQAQDMSKLGFMQDLIRGIKKIAKADEPKQAPKETVVIGGNANVAPLLKRAFMFLEDGEWSKADDFCEQVLNQDPENAKAYLGKLMAELQVRRQEDLPNCEQPFNISNNYQKAVRFGSEEFAGVLSGYIDHINERNENARLTDIYNGAVSAMKEAKTERTYKVAAKTFEKIHGFQDADSLAEQCLERAEVCRKDEAYASAMMSMKGNTISGYEAAFERFSTISGWKDADVQIEACQRKIEELKSKEEEDRLERERKAEQAAKKLKKMIAIVTSSLVILIAFLIVLTKIIIPNTKYNSAVKLYDAGKYDEAITAFTALNGYKDSDELIEECKYNSAVDFYNAGKYNEAIIAFKALNGYKDSAAQIERCETAIKDKQYNAAVALYDAGKYNEAFYAFSVMNGYKDSAAQMEKCETAMKDKQYNDAVALINDGKIVDAYEILIALNGYKDSATKASEIFDRYKIEKRKIAEVGENILFGTYEQDNNTSNGKEDIEWIVLAKENGKALVISKYALDCQEYNKYWRDLTWEECSMRKWLNGTFLNNAFSAEEQGHIVSSSISNPDNPKYKTDGGNDTTDKVFLLSIPEAEKYFTDDSARRCTLTAYGIAQRGIGDHDSCRWWLRSTGHNLSHASNIDPKGQIDFSGLGNDGTTIGVRPALWINLDA